MLHIEIRNMEITDFNDDSKFKNKPDLIKVDRYFKTMYRKLKVDNQLLIDAVKAIDDTDASGTRMESDYIGGSTTQDLSTGAKGIILMWHEYWKHTFCARYYGENCAEWIYNIAYGSEKYHNEPREVYTVMQSYIPDIFKFFKDTDKVEIDGEIYTKKDNPNQIIMNKFFNKLRFDETEEPPFEIDWTGIDKSIYTQEEIDDMIENRIQPQTPEEMQEMLRMLEADIANGDI